MKNWFGHGRPSRIGCYGPVYIYIHRGGCYLTSVGLLRLTPIVNNDAAQLEGWYALMCLFFFFEISLRSLSILWYRWTFQDER